MGSQIKQIISFMWAQRTGQFFLLASDIYRQAICPEDTRTPRRFFLHPQIPQFS